ncbi:NUDIX hydrolase [Alkalilimnicola sp. S0819]|uniref:NUDIX hydrolase n=1 Tax=Alkalilimnicola sp. S0819 TaxID=2613922 RepID=UPI001261C108|nr:NUDIX hydrolase [Alkalilimnicola sp. S0819]KAB7627509.1 NUDIX hydrolase [Alkalilimnicola sp. S0819]MPQ15663.1 NUDIX domain-containing protein [Alkalilimnicola sp. S0819]
MVWRPRVTVAAVIEREGRLLMVEERRGGRLLLNQPAGHLESGESLIQAVVREVLEETAWDFLPQALIGLYRWRSADGDTFLRAAFAGEPLYWHEERALDPDIERCLWVAPTELAQHALRSPLVARCVEDYLAGARYPLALLSDL